MTGTPGSIAVCGLAHRAGTSTIAWLLAHTAALAGTRGLTLAELPAAAGGLAHIAGASSPGSLLDLEAGALPRVPWLILDSGIQLIAGHRDGAEHGNLEQLASALSALRASDTTTVLDCGHVETPGAEVALELASHVVWVVEADARAADLVGRVLLDEDPVPTCGAGPELLVACALDPSYAVADLALRNVAAERCHRLVLVPHLRRPPCGGRTPDRTVIQLAIDPILSHLGLTPGASGRPRGA